MLSAATRAHLPALQQVMDEQLSAVPNEHLQKAMRYSVDAGGKRLRPLLLLSVVDTFAGDSTQAMPAAAALEFLHTYSLIHDDLPAMDDDALRRGKPTSHEVFGYAMAILAGDALQAEAFMLLSAVQAEPATVVALTQRFAQAVGSRGMVAGQVLDMDGENQQYDLAELHHLHAMKTGALIMAAVDMGAILADVSAADRDVLNDFAQAFGVAFQIQDDINDVTKTSAQLGKTADKDEAEHKNTYPALLGLDGAKAALRDQIGAARQALTRLSRPAPELTAFLTYFE